MAACRECQTELASIGCARCSPKPSVELLEEIERDVQWSRASSHRVGSQRGKTLFWIGGGIGVLALLMLPSYRDAVELAPAYGTA